jgi:hypothetical protein
MLDVSRGPGLNSGKGEIGSAVLNVKIYTHRNVGVHVRFPSVGERDMIVRHAGLTVLSIGK